MSNALFSKIRIQRLAAAMAAILFYESVALPLAQAAVIAPPAPASNSSSLSIVNDRQSALTAKNLNTTFRIPSSVGSLAESYAPSSTGRLVYHFQDVHNHVAAQTNMAEMVSLLEMHARAQGKNLVVAVEGVWTPVNSDAIAAMPNQKNKEDVGAALLRAGYLMGEEYAAITNAPGRIKLVGIESQSLYHQNIHARSSSRAARMNVLAAIKETRSQLEKLKRHNFSVLLTTLEEKRLGVEAGTVSLTDYASFLANTNPSVIASHPQLSRLVRVNGLEAAVDFASVEKESQVLVSELTLSSSNEGVEKMMEDAEALKRGQLSALSYYSSLLRQTNKSYPAVSAYVAYLAAADGIDADRLFDEVTEAEQQVAHRLIRHPLAQQLYDYLRWAERQEKFFSLNLIPQEWAQEKNSTVQTVEARLASIRSFINEQQMDLGYRFPTPALSSSDLSVAVEGAGAFYRAAVSRNPAMVENLTRVLKEYPSSQSVVVFISGGFHTPEMTKLLRAKGLAYEVFRPQLETEVTLSTDLNLPTRRVDYVKPTGVLSTADGVQAVRNAVDDTSAIDQVPAAVAEQGVAVGKDGVDFVESSELLPRMLEEAAALVGATVDELKTDTKKLIAAANAYNLKIGGQKELIGGRDYKAVQPKPYAIPKAASRDFIQNFLAGSARKENVWMASAGGRGTRLELPAEFDEIGLAGLTPRLLRALQAAGYHDASQKLAQMPAAGEFSDLIKRAAAGIVETEDDLSFIQRDVLQLVEQTKKEYEQEPLSGLSLQQVLEGLQFIVTVNDSNKQALANQLAAINFPGTIYLIVQPEEGELNLKTGKWDNSRRLPAGHYDPFVSMVQRTYGSYKLEKDGSLTELSIPLRDVLIQNGGKYLSFNQSNNLHLLSNAAGFERWQTGLAAMESGVQMVLEMMDNKQLKQNAGGAVTNPNSPDGADVVLRDTLALEDSALDVYRVPLSASGMSYILSFEGMDELTWSAVPAYLKVQKNADGSARAVTLERLSGDASSVLRTRTMQEEGAAMNTFKERKRIPQALAAIDAQNAAKIFDLFKSLKKTSVPPANNINILETLAASFISAAVGVGVIQMLSQAHSNIQIVGLALVSAVAIIASLSLLIISTYMFVRELNKNERLSGGPVLLNSIVGTVVTAKQAENIQRFADKVSAASVMVTSGSSAKVTLDSEGRKVLQVGLSVVLDPVLQKIVLSHEYVHFTRFQLPLTNRFHGLNELVAYPMGLLLMAVPLSWLLAPSKNEGATFASVALDAAVSAEGRRKQDLEERLRLFFSKYQGSGLETPAKIAVDVDVLEEAFNDPSLSQPELFIRVQLHLNKGLSLSSLPGAEVPLFSKTGNAALVNTVYVLLKQYESQFKNIHFAPAVDADVTSISDIFSKAQFDSANLRRETTFVLSKPNTAKIGNATNIDVLGVPHLALAIFTFSRYKNGEDALKDLAALFEDIWKLDMSGRLTDQIARELLAAIQA